MTWPPKNQKQKKIFVLFIALFGLFGSYSLIRSYALRPQKTFSGQVISVRADDFKKNRSIDKGLFLRQASGLLLHLKGVDENKYLGKYVKIQGQQSQDTLLAATGTNPQIISVDAPAATLISGRNVLVILFNFQDDNSQPFTVAQVNSKLFSSSAPSVSSYYNEVSHSQLQLTGNVSGWLTVPYNKSAGCNDSQRLAWTTSADSQVQASGVNLANYTHKVYVFPNVNSCGYAGLAELGGTRSWLNGGGSTDNVFNIDVASHEIGHNFGSSHASSWACRDIQGQPVPYSAYCKHNEYGDSFDVMGGVTHLDYPTHIQYWRRGLYGWGSDYQQLTASGTYNLAPADPSSGAPHSLRIARSDGTNWEIEYRQPYGDYDFNPVDPYYNATKLGSKGLLIRQIPDCYCSQYTHLINGNPFDLNGKNYEFPLGYSFVDEINHIRVTNVGQSPSGVSVKVDFGYGLSGDPSAPSAPGQLFANSPNSTPNQVSLSWHKSTDNVGVTSYDVYRDYSTKIATVTTPSYQDIGLATSSFHEYHIIARDGAGNSSIASVVSVTTGTSQPIPVTITAPLSGQTISGIFSLSFTPSPPQYMKGEIKLDSGPWLLTPATNGDRIDTNSYGNGVHVISVRTVDSASGLRGPISTVDVNIQNPAKSSITNGSFESGTLDGWTIFNYPRSINNTIITTDTPHSGNFAGFIESYLGGLGDSSLEQKIKIPTSATLSFWYNMECNNSPAFGWFKAEIINKSGKVVKTPLARTCTNGQGWQQSQTDLSDLAGKTVLIRFTDHGDYDFQHQTKTLIDDVSINTP